MKTQLAPSLRQLLEKLDLALKFGNIDELESSCHNLLANVRYDTFQGIIKRDYTERESVGESSNPVVIFERLAKFKGETLTGARVIVTCGHCGNEDKSRYVHSGGQPGANHIDFVLDNFPEEL